MCYCFASNNSGIATSTVPFCPKLVGDCNFDPPVYRVKILGNNNLQGLACVRVFGNDNLLGFALCQDIGGLQLAGF